ncbi:MAG TPA: PAS domain S-box protein [Candidatus Acidoferrum sp.]|nr:PAS domain S-box protein [Candidatus Acidoferrum sp.]
MLLVSCAIVALHIGMATIFKTWAYTPLVSNGLQILASFLAAAACFGARKRGRGLSRPFWLLAGLGFASWGVSNFLWGYYEVALHMEPPSGSLVRFLFDVQGAFFAMAVLQEEHDKSAHSILESLADFTQLVVVFTLIYIGLYYIPSLHMNSRDALHLEIRMEMGENFGLVALALFQRLRSSVKQTRTLFGGLALYLAAYAIGTAVAEFHENVQQSPTGNLYDLCWTIPLLIGAVWAAGWQPVEEAASPAAKPATFSRLLMNNVTYALAPLIVLVQVAGLPIEWRVLRYSLLAVSILCYAVRLGVSQLRESRSSETARRHTLAMDSAVDGMGVLNSAGVYIYANSAYARMMGQAGPETMIGKTWREVADARDSDPVEREIREALQAKGKWFGPLNVHQGDGTVFPLEMAITLLPDGGTVCVSRDISDRRSAELARVQAEFKYQTLVEQVAAISYIAELGIDGQWLYVSPQIESIFGYSVEEWLAESTNWIRHIPVEDHSVIWAAEEASKRGAPFHVEYRVVRKDGKTVWVSDTAVVVGIGGERPMMEGIIVDITERKQHENQSQQSRRMEAVGRLAGGIAHDFNNLLTIINGYAEMALNRAGLPAGAAADVQQISGAADRAAALVRQLLAFSRRQVLQPKAIDVNSIVVGLDKLLRRLMDENIEMHTICAENLGTVKADPAQIEQVVMNLVVNARDAMPHGGRLTVETANVTLDEGYAGEHVPVKAGKYVMLAVSDTGMGMDAEAQTHIFEPFYTTKGSGRGTGLGLSTVYGIVKQSGGYIWVYSEVNRGTTFKLYLPRVEGGAAPTIGASKDLVAAQGTETILLVEDEEAVRELARTVLAAQGYKILEAESAERAEQVADRAKGKIDLLLTDVMMPGTSGRELARKMTARMPKLRVLFMSGYTDNVIAQGGVLEAGVSFLQKPFSPRGLAAKVREVLDQPVTAN